MESRGISRYKPAKDCRLSPTTITNWLEGKAVPGKTKIRAVSDYMNLIPGLVTGERDMLAKPPFGQGY